MLGLETKALLGAAVTAVALVGGGAAAATRGRRGEPYEDFEQAPFAPPSWAFGPVWTINKVAGAWSVARVATDAPADGPDPHATARRVAQGAAVAEAMTYLAFPLVYFRLRSPLLAAAVTCASAAATVTQAEATRRFDRPAAAALTPQLAWLALATPVALYQAAKNDDPLLGTAAPV